MNYSQKLLPAVLLNADEKGIALTDTPGGKQEMAIGNGSSLGSFVAKRVNPAYKESIGRWGEVNHYEVNSDLDEAIHAYFNQPRQLGFGE